MITSLDCQIKNEISDTPMKLPTLFSPFPISSTKYFHMGVNQLSESMLNMNQSPSSYIDPLIQTRNEIISFNETFQKLVQISMKKRNIKDMKCHKALKIQKNETYYNGNGKNQENKGSDNFDSSCKKISTPNKEDCDQINKKFDGIKESEDTSKSTIDSKNIEHDKKDLKDCIDCSEFKLCEIFSVKNSQSSLEQNKVPKRRKRKTLDQMKILMEEFLKNPSWPKSIMPEVASKVGLSEAQVYKWGWDQKKKKLIE